MVSNLLRKLCRVTIAVTRPSNPPSCRLMALETTSAGTRSVRVTTGSLMKSPVSGCSRWIR
jgi:hypothetical protein